ncbi:hypothetical protein [Neotamlana laminarinivorans]|uniref:Uncharacterized protein n=1 Tax=Neotamlana laminarinivorans TaxID=2883124 RepID=A0A9X1L4W8_9FLAO|nr:hypothetical protein [Tamlana laminarinivorans]MCB4798731.1 hypothetical protein [Tamlana laminarinivorans]
MEDKITKTLNAVDKIKPVNVSPFFKDKTMQKLFAEKEIVKENTIWSWFTPKLQLATLVLVITVNVWAFSKITSDSLYQNNVNQLAETFGLNSNTQNSFLNQ